MHTPYSRIQVRFNYTEQYPESSAILELTSPSLPPGLLRNKEKECLDKIQKGKAQFQVIYEHIHSFVHTNMFLPCWKEMKQVANLYSDTAKCNIGVDDKSGILIMKMQEKKYKLTVKLTAPDFYPEEELKLE